MQHRQSITHYTETCKLFQQLMMTKLIMGSDNSLFQSQCLHLNFYYHFYDQQNLFYIRSNNLIRLMGSTICPSNSKQLKKDPYELLLGADENQNLGHHSLPIISDEPEIQKLLNVFIKDLQTKNAQFKDPIIPIQPIILKSNQYSYSCNYYRPYVFLRDIQRGQPYPILDEVISTPNQIFIMDASMQYFGVFLCFLADKPQLIKKIIKTKSNTYGIHCLKVYERNRQKYMLIDDYILCGKQNSRVQPFFTQPYQNVYMWTCLIEKAWQKLKIDLSTAIKAYSIEELFSVFRPLPLQKQYIEEWEEPEKKIDQIFLQRKKKTQSFILISSENPQHKIGLVGSRPFYLLDTFLSGNERVFYIRNPCGQQSFRGIHNIIPFNIEEKLRQRNVFSSDDCNFLLDQTQFLEQISQIITVNYAKGNATRFDHFSMTDDEMIIGFSIKDRGLISLETEQIWSNKSTEEYYPFIYHVVSIYDTKVIGGKRNKEGYLGSKSINLLDDSQSIIEPGRYLIRLKKKGQNKAQKIEVCLKSYFGHDIQFDQLVGFSELSRLWDEFLVEYGKQQLKSKIEREKIITQNHEIVHVISWIGDIVYLYIQNFNIKRKQVNIEANFPQLQNLCCVSHPQVNPHEYFKLKCNDHAIISFQKVNLKQKAMVGKYHLESF